MTLQERREYSALRAHIEVCIADYADETLISLLKPDITAELSDIICEELRTRAQRLTDAVAGAQDDIPVADSYRMPEMNETIKLMYDLFNTK